MTDLDLTKFDGHTPGPWRSKELATYQQPGNVVMWADKGGEHMRRLDYQGGFTAIDASLIAAAPALLAEVKRQAAEIERLKADLSRERTAHEETRLARNRARLDGIAEACKNLRPRSCG